MQDFQNSMETFFLNVFNSSVPAYSGDDSHTRATIVRDFMKKYPGCINDTRSNSLIDYDSIYYLAKSRNMSEESLINEIIEAHKQAVASVAPDYYPIVDGGWLATYANLQKTGMPHFATEPLIMTRAQMDVQVFVNMIAPPITTYSYGNPFINWSSYPFNPNKIV